MRHSCYFSVLVIGLWASVCQSSSFADPLTLTISYQDLTTGYSAIPAISTLTPVTSTTAASLSGCYGSISYDVSGFADLTGTLSTLEASLTNTSSIAHHIVITFDATGFSLPSGSDVLIDTQFTTNVTSGQSADNPSTMSADASGGITFNRDNVSLETPDLSPVLVVVPENPGTGTYELTEVYDLWVQNGKISAAIQMDPMDPTPEPWTVGILAAMLPVALLYNEVRARRIAKNIAPILANFMQSENQT